MAKILIVEDNPVNMELAKDLLEMAGHVIFEATNGREAIDVAGSFLPDLILMDIQLPGIDGLAATRVIKSNAATCEIPVIALTAFAMKTDENKSREAGCAGFITKPINTRLFSQMVEDFLKAEGTP